MLAIMTIANITSTTSANKISTSTLIEDDATGSGKEEGTLCVVVIIILRFPNQAHTITSDRAKGLVRKQGGVGRY